MPENPYFRVPVPGDPEYTRYEAEVFDGVLIVRMGDVEVHLDYDKALVRVLLDGARVRVSVDGVVVG